MNKNKETKPIKKQRPLTIKQRKFIEVLEETGNATEAASRVYNVKNRNVANNIGAENLAKPSIKDTLEERVRLAKDKIFYLSQNGDKHEVQLKASQDIIDRVEGKPVQPTKEDKNLNLNVNIKEMTNEELDEMIKKSLAK